MRVPEIPDNQFMRDPVFQAGVLKSLNTSICGNVLLDRGIDVHEYITAIFEKQAGRLHGSHIIIRIYAVDISILALDGNNGDLIGGQLF